MNWFGMACSVLQACAAVEAAAAGNGRMAVVWACYALAGAMIARA